MIILCMFCGNYWLCARIHFLTCSFNSKYFTNMYILSEPFFETVFDMVIITLFQGGAPF